LAWGPWRSVQRRGGWKQRLLRRLEARSGSAGATPSGALALLAGDQGGRRCGGGRLVRCLSVPAGVGVGAAVFAFFRERKQGRGDRKETRSIVSFCSLVAWKESTRWEAWIKTRRISQGLTGFVRGCDPGRV
jgi:hypothetical protein